MADRPLIDYSLALLNLSGLVTYQNDIWGKLRKFVLVTSLVILYVDIQICTIVKWNEPDSIENMLGSIAMVQIVFKIAVFKSEYVWITVNKMKKFYPINKYGFQQAEINKKIFAKVKVFLNMFLMNFFVIIIIFSSKTFFYANKKLPFGSILFGSERAYIFEMGFMYQLVVMFFLVPIQCGFDFLYISFITNFVCEFKLVKAGFSQIPIGKTSETDEHTLEVLGNLIVHHNVILDCTKSLRRVYYIPFLCIFFFNMLGIGFCLLCVIANGIFQNLAVSLVYGMIALFYTLQLLIYCGPGTILISESTQVSDIAFNTDWWIKTQPKLRKTYIRILQRANKPVLLSAGGMMNVTLESFNSIVKSALSFFTCVQAMYKKS